jgi:transposase-like protein
MMDPAVTRFHEAATRENGQRPLRRRYSAALQQQAIAYWTRRRRQDGVRTIAAALGVSTSTLQRWARRATRRPRFQPVTVTKAPPAADGALVVIQITADGPRIEGLTLEHAARLLRLLR